ncbi:putative f-box protein [Quercus suber]|uniref:F-box protein n=2 Tax=Quercus suber TaxID=58331 RepID=A0AAW0L848_QUESU
MLRALATVEHGGQVGMVFEMYRDSVGFFRLINETIE